MQVKRDAGRKRLTSAGSPRLTMNDRCAQAMTDAGNPWPTLAEQYALAVTDAGGPRQIAHG